MSLNRGVADSQPQKACLSGRIPHFLSLNQKGAVALNSLQYVQDKGLFILLIGGGVI